VFVFGESTDNMLNCKANLQTFARRSYVFVKKIAMCYASILISSLLNALLFKKRPFCADRCITLNRPSYGR